MSAVATLFATKPRPASAGPARLAAYIADGPTREALAAALGAEAARAQIAEGGLAAALSAIAHGPAPELAIVDVSGSEDPVGGTAMLVSALRPVGSLVVVGTINDIGLYRALADVGAVEYLVKPVAPEAFAGALATVESRRQGAAPGKADSGARNAKVITVMGTRGGVGATTVAVNMAWTLAHQAGRKVALVDLDLRFGTVALALDLEPTHGLREVLENPDRIDSLFVSSAMAKESDALSVLSAEEPAGDRVQIAPDAFDALIADLRQNFDELIIDLPRGAAVPEDHVVLRSDKLVLVSDFTLAAMRDTVRLVSWAKSVTAETEIVLALNKAGAVAKGEVPKSEFERAAQITVAHVLPYDPKSAGAAASAGRPVAVAGKGGALAKVLSKASLDIAAAGKAKPARRGLFRKK